jgi:hypothetical protein
VGLILGAATILGGVASLWFFWDKIAAWWHGQPAPPPAPALPAPVEPNKGEAAGEDQAAVARTLLEEVKRIHTELGPPPQRGVPVLGQVAPRLTAWLQPVIPKIAPSSAAAVGAFMTLERSLKNYESALRNFRTGCDKRDEAMETRDSLYGSYAAEARKPGASKPEEVGTYMEASRRAELAEQAVGQALDLADTRWRDCDSDLRKLEELLKPITGQRFAPLVVDDDGRPRYVSWRGRDPLHLIRDEELPRQLWAFATPLCNALRRDSGLEPQFHLPTNIRGEVVYELSQDFRAKWRLLGGRHDGAGEQVLVLVPKK